MHSPYFRARYYDPHIAEFTSPDPLEYVDGMSLFRGYFVINFFDAWGTKVDITVVSHTKTTSKPSCRNTGNLGAKYDFKIDGPLQSGGWIVQKVTVKCGKGSCRSRTERNHCVPAQTSTSCNPNEMTDSFVYFEAWPVSKDGKVVNPDGKPRAINDIATPNSKNKPKFETCGFVEQIGEIRFYYDHEIDPNDRRWTKQVVNYGNEKECKTSAGGLWSFDGKGADGNEQAPTYWKNEPAATASRSWSISWSCCRGKHGPKNYVDQQIEPKPAS